MSRRLIIPLLFWFSSSAIQADIVEGKWDYVITITTNYGEMTAILFEETPKHKANFLKLINQGYYDGLLFHRVIKDFMIQAGDPDSRIAAPGAALGRGGPGYTVPAEIKPKFFHKKGALCAARQPDRVNPHKASSGSQFYIVQGDTIAEDRLVPLNREILNDALKKIRPNTPLSDSLRAALGQSREAFEAKLVAMSEEVYTATGFRLAVPDERVAVYTSTGGAPHLDDQYTIFGQVIVGLEVIDKIAAVETGRGARPVEDVVMTSVTAKRMKRKKITKTYGYVYE